MNFLSNKNSNSARFSLGVFLVLMITVFLPSTSSAQVNNFTGDNVSIVLVPEHPEPYGNIKATVDSSAIDLTGATITWTLNGKIVLSGKDKRSFEGQLPAIGKPYDLKVSINYSGVTIDKNVSIVPATIDIIYEANSYTPPLYQGKALAPSESSITLLAIPNFKTTSGKTLSAKNLVFTWKKGGLVDQSASGLGKDSYIYRAGRLQEDGPQVEVTVVSPENNLVAYSSFVAPLVSPEVVFYENNPLKGVLLEKALSGVYNFGDQDSISLIASPYFMSGKNRTSSNFNYSWQVNGTNIKNTSDDKSLITIKRPGGKGESLLSVLVENSARIFQAAKVNLDIFYGQ